MGFLSDHCSRVRAELAARPLDRDGLATRAAGRAAPLDLARAIGSVAQRPAVIAEVKQASPSAGLIRQTDPASQAVAYRDAGAAAISVLTEPEHFGGDIADLAAVREAVALPLMRKDFIVHPDQIVEARAHGADAVLLVATVLTADELASLLEVVQANGMTALVEAFGHEDLDRAVASGAQVIGVNARNLETLEMHEDSALGLLASIPTDRVRVFESGISRRDQVERAVEAGADAILVGTALMQADDPGAKLRELVSA